MKHGNSNWLNHMIALCEEILAITYDVEDRQAFLTDKSAFFEVKTRLVYLGSLLRRIPCGERELLSSVYDEIVKFREKTADLSLKEEVSYVCHVAMTDVPTLITLLRSMVSGKLQKAEPKNKFTETARIFTGAAACIFGISLYLFVVHGVVNEPEEPLNYHEGRRTMQIPPEIRQTLISPEIINGVAGSVENDIFTPTNIFYLPEEGSEWSAEDIFSLLEYYGFYLANVEIWTGGRYDLRGEVHYVRSSRRYFKSWMDFRAITSRTSRQWYLQQLAHTDDLGFRRIDDLYMVAVGTYFLEYGVGDVFEVTLSSGIVFRAVAGDVKSDEHTDPTNRFTLHNGCMLEFIVDRPYMDDMARRMGDMSWAGLAGDIVTIERIPGLRIGF